MTDRERDDTGKYVETVPREAVVEAVQAADTPVVTARDVGETLGCSVDAARKKLSLLHDEGRIDRMTVGASAVVWWLSESPPNAESIPHEQAFEDFADRAMDEVGDHIEKLVLYGSTARGEAHGIKSDVDIFIVVDTLDVKSELYAISQDVMLQYEVVPSLQIQTVDEFEQEKDRPFVKDILQDGRAYA
jgi:predicted nucleotidyltransferase